MVAGEKSARDLFNTATKIGNITFDNLGLQGGKQGQLFDFDALSNMTKKDLPLALETISKMYMQGQLSTQTMQKMFTARHFMEISSLLIDINGNVDGFVNGIAKGVNYSDDFYKKMFDINKQWEQLKNNMIATASGQGDYITNSFTGILIKLNEILPSLNTSGKETFSTLTSLSTAFVLTSTAAGAFIKYLIPLVSTGGPVGLALGALAVGALVIGNNIAKTSKHIADLNLNYTNSLYLQKKTENQLKDNLALQTKMRDVVYELMEAQSKGTENVDIESTLWGQLSAKNKDLQAIFESFENYKLIDATLLPPAYNEDLKELERNIKRTTTFMQQAKDTGLDNYLAIMGQSREGQEYISDEASKEEDDYWNKRMANAKTFYAEYIRLVEQGVKASDLKGRMDEFGASLGMVKNEMEQIYQSIPIKPIEENVTAMGLYFEELKKYNKELKDSFKDINDQININNTAINRLIAYGSKLDLDIFSKTGEYKGQKGFKGLISMAEEQSVSEYTLGIEASTIALKDLNDVKSRIQEEIKVGTKGNKDVTKQEEELKDINKSILKQQSQLTVYKNEQLQYEKEGYVINKDYYNNLTKGLTDTDKTRAILVDIVNQEKKLKYLKQYNPDNTSQIKKVEDNIEKTKTILKIESDVANEKKRKTDYQIKYTNYIKEDLSVQLEIAKLMQTQGAQQIIMYQYKKKELELNREQSRLDVNSARETLAEKGVDSSGITDSRQAQEMLRTMETKYGSVIQDKLIKEQVDGYKELAKALAKEEDLNRKIMILPWKELNDILETIPNTVENAFKSLGDLGEMTGEFGFKTKFQEYLDRDLKNQVQQFNDAFTLTTDKKGNTVKTKLYESLSLEDIPARLEKAQKELLIQEDKMRAIISRRDSGAKLTPEEEKQLDLLNKQKKETEDLTNLNGGIIKNKKTQLEIDLQILDVYVKMGDTLSKFGSAINSQGLQDFGEMFSSFGAMQKSMKDKPASFGAMFKGFGTEKWTDNIGNNLENAMAGIDFGASIGSQVSKTIGGGQSAVSGGALGGMIAGAGGASALAGMFGKDSKFSVGVASMAISAGMSLIGGLFDKGGNEQAKADKKTAEAKKAYDKNTDALNELSKNMASLNAGIDTLNGSLISSFSNLPTFGNINDVTSTLEEMYTLMYTTRNFDSVSYQVTKTKKGKKGFIGIGSTAGSSWTETYEKDIQEMLDIYGYKGTIYDMSTKEMRKFADWLDEYDMGDTDNFSVMADALEEYAEALEKFDKNIDKFFYDTTMESFVGISSMQQEALRQQIEDFYKDLGIVIDEEMSAEIDKLAEQMSVMVTIMQDVRGSFIDIWMNTGDEAGSAFVKSMKPYMEALMNNMAQIFYDVYLSDVTKGLNDEFKLMSEELVELKKQGSELKWEDVTDSLSDNFAKVLEYISSAKEQTASFNDVILELQKQALEAGFTISELIDMGIATGTQKTVVDTFQQAILSDEEAFISLGKAVGDMIGDAMAKSMIDNLMSEQVLAFSNQLDGVLNGSMSFDSLTDLAGEALSIGMMMESERKRLEAITDMFNMGDVTYENQESTIKYDTGVSSQIQNHYYLTSTLEAGNVIEADSAERLLDSMIDQLIEKLKVDKGIDITKNY